MDPHQEPGTPPEAEILILIRQLPDAVFRCEKRADGKVYLTFYEGRLAEEFGATTKPGEGTPLEELLPGGVAAELRRHFEEAFAGRPYVFITEVDGRHFRHHPQPVYGPDGEVHEVIGFVTEVTEMMQADELIREMNHEMMQRVLSLKQANEALQETNENLARANQDLDAFAFTISHDLRTPLTIVQNLCYILQSKYRDALGQDGQQKVERIRTAMRRMDTMITGVLRFSRASRAPLEWGRVDLSAIARAVAADTPQPDPPIAWDIEPGLRVEGDASLLQVLMENLLGNSVKYAGDRTDRRISFRRRELPDGPVYEVADNGIGFTAEDAAQIFEPFHRLESARTFAGSGIGLATALRIVERHGGRIWAEPGAPGARVLFTLPAPRAK